ncbi:transcriptional regulator, ArsR family [Rathayibacter oskolensis]|uniref:Transcriptional regulator, ArsR family n=1 Tax=Rathayibacter oskolensis TaxID=1891671 RepID=A0A1X7PHK6_9MICO|nr:metalloregulator ArsR/SmtB family transcription factor [Rathayibacter oskolensis]SMH51026.1 transcriptional regulator, ArsR family [Rathayibacter oskolensis]
MPVVELPAPSVGAPSAREPLSAESAHALARSLKAVADPARLRLVSIVAASASGEVCVCDFTEPVGLSQPTVSHHLKVLVDAGILQREKRGPWAYFSLVPGALGALAGLLADL